MCVNVTTLRPTERSAGRHVGRRERQRRHQRNASRCVRACVRTSRRVASCQRRPSAVSASRDGVLYYRLRGVRSPRETIRGGNEKDRDAGTTAATHTEGQRREGDGASGEGPARAGRRARERRERDSRARTRGVWRGATSRRVSGDGESEVARRACGYP